MTEVPRPVPIEQLKLPLLGRVNNRRMTTGLTTRSQFLALIHR